jgi:DNA polymerase-4
MANKVIFLIDMQSFYASVEKADRPELKDKPVVVSGDPERRSGVILAACPLAKKYGVQNAERLWEAQQRCPQAIVVRPRMQRYMDVSLQITDILEWYTDLVEPYSVDEQFMDLTGSQTLFGSSYEIAEKVKGTIEEDTGVPARIGIGANKVLAKIACDNFSKKNDSGISELNKSNMQEFMWPLPVEKMFGIGRRMSQHLRKMGIRTVGQLANASLPMLKRRWGVPGHVIWMTANGIDYSPVSRETHNGRKAIGHAMTLPRDYGLEKDIKVVLLELCEEVCFRARNSGMMGYTVSAGVRGADFDRPTGFHRQVKLLSATNNTMDVFHAAWELCTKFWDRDPVRRVGVNLSNLCSDQEWQLNLFEKQNEKKRHIGYVMDNIKKRYGTTAIVRAASLTNAGQALERAEKIGGHYK